MRVVLPLVAGLAAYAAWRWLPIVLEPLGLDEFLFVGRFCAIVGVLTVTETIFQKVRS
jgi:hypothetical protein